MARKAPPRDIFGDVDNPRASSRSTSRAGNGMSYDIEGIETEDDGEDSWTTWDLETQTKKNMAASTHRSKALVEESQRIMADTCSELANQGEQLDRIEGRLDKIDNDLVVSDRIVNSMRSFWSTTKSALFGTKPITRAPVTQQAGPNVDREGLKTFSIGSSTLSTSKGTSAVGGPKTKAEVEAYTVDRNDRDLEHISQGLSILKSGALMINAELDRQNSALDRINDKADNTAARVASIDTKVKKML